MSEFRVPVVRIGKVEKHTNADALSITKIEGENVILRTGDFVEGDLAIYVPVDAVVPATVPGTDFLGEHRRIRAKRLRGVYSEGLLLPYKIVKSSIINTDPVEGTDVSLLLGITKHEDKIPDVWGTSVQGASVPGKRGIAGRFFHWCFRDQLRTHEKDPGCLPVYDIEPFGRYKHLLVPEERVIITEKIHGANARYAHLDQLDTFYVGSRNNFWRDLRDRKVPWREYFGEFVRTYVLRHSKRGPAQPTCTGPSLASTSCQPS